MKTLLFRITQDGSTVWQGRAYDVEHAIEKAFFDETPGTLERFDMDRWGRVKLSRSIKSQGWVNVFRNECLAPY
jgi:hypothetical protein